jgi:hypothetical protein
MEILFSMISFFALIAAWFVLPSAPRTAQEVPLRTTTEAMPSAA